MAELLLEEKQDLTFEQITPFWFEYLTANAHYDLLNILNQQYCIVGESHRFKSDDYDGCRDCKRLSIDFIDLMEKAKWTKDELESNNTVQEFTKHWNKKHRIKK